MRLIASMTIVLVIGSAACTEKQLLTGPLVPYPRDIIIPPREPGLELPTTDSSPATTKPLPSYYDPIIVEVGASKVDIDDQRSSYSRTALQRFDGRFGDNGVRVWNACYVNVSFPWSIQGSIGPGPCLSPPSQRATWADTILVAGNGTVTRGPGVPQYTADCDYTRCHSYSGSQTAWVTPLPANLLLKSPDSKVVKGTTVTFKASVSPDSIKHIKVPLRVLSWQWIPSSGPGTTAPVRHQ